MGAMIRITLLLATLAATALAACDNSCSGHGVCECGFCVCYDNWGMGLSHDTGDCSDRICPFELAWVDSPDKNGRRHKYAECAGRGVCNRGTGECECFDGYEGKGCQRTACPNDCSGHGQCEYIQDLHYGAVEFDFRHQEFNQLPATFTYYGWDNQKTRGCVCDPEWADVDCSKRMCPYGNDVMDKRDDLTTPAKYHIQAIVFQIDGSNVANLDDKTFALTFKTKLNETFTTTPIVIDSNDALGMSTAVRSALLRLPNKVIDDVHVHSEVYNDGTDDFIKINVTFTGENVQGTQHLLTVEDYRCQDGCFPKITGMTLKPLTSNVTDHQLSDFNSYECGRRGKCDYTTGICQCFEGFTGPTCGQCTSLI